MMPGTPPALAQPPQFTTAYWDKAPRAMVKTKLDRITKVGDTHTEFVFDGGARAFQRNNDELNPDMMKLLHANSEVFVQTFNGELVTGLFVPNNGWVFQMTSEDMVDYAKRLSAAAHKQRQDAMEELKAFVTSVLLAALRDQAGVREAEGGYDITGPVDLSEVAGYVVSAMSSAKSAGAR